MNLSQSKLTKSQQKSMTKIIGSEKLIVKIRHDDSCGNGHNTFSITKRSRPCHRSVVCNMARGRA